MLINLTPYLDYTIEMRIFVFARISLRVTVTAMVMVGIKTYKVSDIYLAESS